MISVIVTAYNVSNTIAATIQSILNQTYQDFELIIVEDCSLDNTLEVIQSIKDNRINIVQHTQNLGAGLARRTGVLNSKGEYTIFVDGDDTLDEDCLKMLYDAAIETNSDIVSCGVRAISDDKCVVFKSEAKAYTDLEKFDCNEDFTLMFLNNKLINHKLWDKVVYSSLRYIEDTPTAFRLFYYANQVLYIDYVGYNYIQNKNGLCHTASNVKSYIFTTLSQIENAIFFKDKEDKYKYLGNRNKVKACLRLFKLDNISFKDISPYINEYNQIVEYLNEE